MASQEPIPQAASTTPGEISPHFDKLLRDVTDALTAEELKDAVATIKNTFEVNSQDQTDHDLYSHLRLFATRDILSEENLTLLERFVACKSSKRKGITKRIDAFKQSRLHSATPKVSGQPIKGRDLDLNVIMAKLTGARAKEIVNLYGPGGVGKTTLGKEICLRWPGQSISVDMREVAEMKDVYFHIMMALDTKRTVLSYDENPVINQLRKLRMDSPSDVLLLLDNVDKFSGGNGDLVKTLNDKMVKLLQRLVEQKNKNEKDEEGIASLKIILISRAPFQGLNPRESDCYEVKALGREFSQEVILEKAGELPVLEIGKIVDMCKGYPLLLNGMAAIIRQKIAAGEKVLTTIKDELTTLETEGETALSPVQDQQEREAWQCLSKEIGEDKLSCLRKMFFLLPTNNLKFSALALSLFCHPFSEETAASVLGVESSEAIIVLEGLRSREVLSVYPDAKELLYDIHPLMRSFLRSIGNSSVFRKVFGKAKDRFRELYFSKMTSISALLDKNYLSAFDHFDHDKPNFEFALELPFKAEDLHRLKEHHERAMIYFLFEAMLDSKQRRNIFKSWAEATEEDGREGSLFRVEMRSNEAMQVLEIHGWKRAADILKLADESFLKVDKRMENGTPYRFASASYLYVAGEIFYKKGSVQEALRNFHSSLDLMEELVGNHTSTTKCLNAIGNCHNALSNFKDAMNFYTRAFEMRKVLSDSKNHLDLSFFKGQIGTVYEMQKEYGKAILCYQEALELSKQLKRSGILRLALFHRNIANAHAWKREYEKAYKSAMDAYEIRKDILGDHPDTARSAFQVGEICRSLDQSEEAEEFLDEAWRIEKSLEMGNHSAVRDRIVQSYENVLTSDRQNEFRQEALEFYVRLWQEDKEFTYAKKSIIDQIIERLDRYGDRKMKSKYRKEALEFYVMAWNSPDLQQLPRIQREEILQIILYLSKLLREKELHKKFQGEQFRFYEKQWEEGTVMTAQDVKDILRTLQRLATQLGDVGKSEKYKKLHEEYRRGASSQQFMQIVPAAGSLAEPSSSSSGGDQPGIVPEKSLKEKKHSIRIENTTSVSQEKSENMFVVKKPVDLSAVEESSSDTQILTKQNEQETAEGDLSKEKDLSTTQDDFPDNRIGIQLRENINRAFGIITSEGGEVTANDVQLVCSPGAVDNPVSVKITLEDPVTYYGLVVQRGLENDIVFGAPIINLLPNGHFFKKPIALTSRIKIDQRGSDYRDVLVLHGTEAKDGTISWRDITQTATINVSKGEVITKLDRFSKVAYLLTLTWISAKEIVSRLNLMPFKYSVSAFFKKSPSELALAFMSEDIFHEPYFKEHHASAFAQMTNEGFELLSMRSTGGHSERSIYNSECLQVSVDLEEDYQVVGEQANRVIVDCSVWWNTGEIIKFPLHAINDVGILCGRIKVQGQYGHSRESHFSEQDLLGYVRRFLGVEGEVFNLIPILAQKIQIHADDVCEDVVKHWQDDDVQLKILLQPWIETGSANTMDHLKKILSDLKEEDYKVTKRGQMHIRNLRELAVKIAALKVHHTDLKKFFIQKIQILCQAVMRDCCIQVENSSEDIDRASSSGNYAKHLELRKKISRRTAAKYQRLISSKDESVVTMFLEIVPNLIQEVKAMFGAQKIPPALNGLRGIDEKTLGPMASNVRESQENNKIRKLICHICKIVEKLCDLNCNSNNPPERVRKLGQSLAILPMLDILQSFFLKCPEEIRLHKRLELLSVCIRDIISDEIEVNEATMRDFFDLSASLIHFAKFDPARMVRFELSDSNNSSVECQRGGLTYETDSDTYYEEFVVDNVIEQDLLLNAVAAISVEGRTHKIGTGAFKLTIVLPASEEETFDECCTSFGSTVSVKKLKDQNSSNFRVVLCSTGKEILSHVVVALERKLKDEVDWKRSEVTPCKLTMRTRATEPSKTSVKLRLVYKWKSAGLRLESQDFIADADINTDSTWGVDDSMDGDATHVLSPLADGSFLNDFAKQQSQTQVPSQVSIVFLSELHQHVHHVHNIQDVNVKSEYCAVGDHSSFSIQEPSTSTRPSLHIASS
ncbi:Tetratricopeptide repeat protein 28 [Stylophora pistillata]|uniref:Tetratricopeptide repeat protein 28 n=1 Tax=Stylophora pistillata TaxID=50429 RepID=A0A2B4RJN6_STYPI|nr:Tetratricopeptide repeat protein 28 [Stylophora pistillata]